MALKLEIYQKENVKPFSPTPQSFRNYKLSLLDQWVGHFYMPLVFFYNSGADSQFHNHDELKESLSKTLSVYYPLAGRLKDGFTIECNDEGADFVRSNVTNCDLADILRHPKQELIRQLFPRDPYPVSFDPAQPMLAVQANRFRCGGTAVAICLWHALADGAGLAGFLQTWAAINRGEGTTNRDSNNLIAYSTAIFPPINMNFSESITSQAAQRESKSGKYSAKRFVFRAEEIERLRDEYNRSAEHRRPTRVETLSAFIWAAVIRATLKANPNLKTYLLTNVVELRRRMNPPFPPTCLGNINHVTAARWEAEPAGDVSGESLVGKVRESIGKVTDDYVRKLHADGGFLKVIKAAGTKAEYSNDNKILSISSWFKFPCLKVDFGWGKSIWVASGNFLPDLALLLDTTDGGVEVWIGLSLEVMYNFENDQEILTHVSFSQDLWGMSTLPSRL